MNIVSRNDPKEHIVEANEVLIAGQGAQHTYSSFKLSRYACYFALSFALMQKKQKIKENPPVGGQAPIALPKFRDFSLPALSKSL